MTVNFVDLLIIDFDTAAFLISVYPDLGRQLGLAVILAVPTLALIWWFDPLRVRRRTAASGFAGCLVGLWTLSALVPSNSENEFYSGQYVSKFARSVLRHIRVTSKHELKQRIMAGIDDVNRHPIIHTWSYKLAEAA